MPVPGTARMHRLERNIGAACVGLTEGDLREIDEVVAGVTVRGERCPPFLAQ
jgi:aryl-alcohol dehydrogenase-like predicted oxidoreductase